MLKRLVAAGGLFLVVMLAAPQQSRANTAKGVGLGVAAGVDLYQEKEIDPTAAFAWGFFVDIPLLDTFFVTPAAMLYEVDLGAGKRAITDVDLNFKFIVPVGSLRFGGGILAGLTTGFGDYVGHYGLLAYGSLNLVANLDFFVMAQYKRLAYGGRNIDNFHGYAGGMFRF